MWPTFFIRVSPASRNAKPACMNMTRTAARTTQIVLEAMRSSSLDTDLHLLQPQTGGVGHDVLDGRAPHETVAGLVPAACRVRDRGLDGPGDFVPNEEGQDGLRQEPRLEHAAAVLVRDAALPAVPDRLDDGDA